MEKEKSRWFTAYLLAGFLGGVSGSIYFTYSRVYLRELLGDESNYIVGLLVSFEQIPQILGVVGGFLADYMGRKKLYSLSFVNPNLYILIPLVDPRLFPYIILLSTLIGSLTGPAVSGAVLTALNRSGRLYSFFVLAPTIGWVIGGVVPGLLINNIGSIGLFILIALISYVSIIIQFIFFPDTSFSKPSLRELSLVFKNTWDVVSANTIVNSGLSIFWTLIGLEIYSETRNLLLYGLLLSSTTALAGAFARPLSGILVDKYNPVYIIVYSLLAYIALDTTILFTRGVARIILWIIPIYPFRDTATTITISRRVSLKLQSTTVGIAATMNSLSGLIVFIISTYTHGDLLKVYCVHIVFLIIAIALLLHKKIIVCFDKLRLLL